MYFCEKANRRELIRKDKKLFSVSIPSFFFVFFCRLYFSSKLNQVLETFPTLLDHTVAVSAVSSSSSLPIYLLPMVGFYVFKTFFPEPLLPRIIITEKNITLYTSSIHTYRVFCIFISIRFLPYFFPTVDHLPCVYNFHSYYL